MKASILASRVAPLKCPLTELTVSPSANIQKLSAGGALRASGFATYLSRGQATFQGETPLGHRHESRVFLFPL
jgi:hypothetical protein